MEKLDEDLTYVYERLAIAMRGKGTERILKEKIAGKNGFYWV